MKRLVGASNELEQAATNSTRATHQKKRFKTSGEAPELPLGQRSAPINETSDAQRVRQHWRTNQVDNDLNNNSIASDDNNNNSGPSWRRNVNSLNGTVDLSQYERNDIDRLYGDALLVYFKNFNE